MRSKPLTDSGRGYMKTVFTRTHIDALCKAAIGQPQRLIPVFDEKWQHEDRVLRVRVREEPTTRTLQNAGGYHVHHFAFAAQNAGKIVFDLNPPTGSLLELLLEKQHGLAAGR